jgi:hypothetical protein
MPTPLPYERQEDFIQRCIPELIEKEGRDKPQATAVCYQIWNKK